MKRIAIFASGSGTNAQKIMEYFEQNKEVEVSLILSNKKTAKVLDRAQNFGVETFTFDRNTFYESNGIINVLQQKDINLIVLAGFLWLIPQSLVEAFSQKIINIHPALLPKYGGKGMYGMKVHQAVFENQEKETGITIHYVNEKYDEGQIIFQAMTDIESKDTPESIAQKVQFLEHRHFPEVIAKVLNSLIKD